ncbi:recombinase family protein [Actinoplanes sp. NPDC049316]|uniref:recombinase family protein n=1 Tax=Actinoplanes sp. NPDC049316 TaxID=3154727 RepID=UPI003413D2B3
MLPTSTVRVAIYTRRSTDEENQPFTIEAQTSKLKSYIKSQDGWTLVQEYSDDASGAKIDRPNLSRALMAARAGLYDVLLVYRVDRFTRRIRDLSALLEELDAAAVVFRSATEPFDTSTPAGRMLVQMLGVFAEFEREMIIDRVVNGMERKAGKGQWTLGVAPEGYLTDPDTQHLVPVEAEMSTIQEIFRIYTQDRVGCRMVAKKINERGMRRRSGALYSFKTIADILSNPVYIGTVLFRDVEVENAHPGIVDRETFDLAQRLLIERGENPATAAGAASEYHLTGKIRCPLCGRTYLGTVAHGRSRAYRYYTCWTRNRYGTDRCPAPRIDADRFDAIVLDALSDFYINNTDLMMEAVRGAQDHHEAVRSKLEAELAAIRSKMTQKEKAVDRYMTDYEEGAIGRDVIERRVKKLSAELTDLRRSRDQLQFELDNTPDKITKTELASINTNITRIITMGHVAQRKALCELALDKIEINTTTSTATPTFRVDIAHTLSAIGGTNKEGAPAGNPAGAHLPSSQAVRERRPTVGRQGLEP